MIWVGNSVTTWARLLARNRFKVHRSRWRAAAAITAASAFNSILGLLQSLSFHKRIIRTQITHDPIFILGHWRSGTTLLHELLNQDQRLAAPTTWDCFAPHHFFLTRDWLPKLFTWLVPSRRPMDNMKTGWNRPQEDEFALALMGQPSPYERIAFPNRAEAGAGSLDLHALSSIDRRQWECKFYRLIQAFTLAHRGRRLVLKSPPHTARIPTLLKLFPKARFIHIVRDPYAVYASTLHLWRYLTASQSLQPPAWEQLPGQINETYLNMFARLAEGKRLLSPNQYHEIRYEDLVSRPLESLQTIYRQLEIGDFESAKPTFETYLAESKGYETNRYVMTREEVQFVTANWGEIIHHYGYAIRTE